MVMNKNIIIYTTTFCQYCETAKQYFSARGFDNYIEKNIEQDPDALIELRTKLNGEIQGVPIIDINGTLLSGFDKNKINKVLGLE